MAADIRRITRPHATVYKLTDANMRTYGGYQWTLKEPKQSSGEGELCTSGWLHCYGHPDLAVWLNPIHASYRPCRLFRAEASGVYRSDGSLKMGVSQLTLLEELPVPQFSRLELTALAIHVVREIPNRQKIPTWETWANKVLHTRTLNRAAAESAAASAADLAARSAAYSAWSAESAQLAALAAESAAESAAWSAADSAAWSAADFSLLRAYQRFLVWRNQQ